jgi:hypothetical protein
MLHLRGVKWGVVAVPLVGSLLLLYALIANSTGRNWVEAEVEKRGGCKNLFQLFGPELLSAYARSMSHPESDPVDALFLDRPLKSWTDEDIEAALRIQRSCETQGTQMQWANAEEVKSRLRKAVENAKNFDAQLTEPDRLARLEARTPRQPRQPPIGPSLIEAAAFLMALHVWPAKAIEVTPLDEKSADVEFPGPEGGYVPKFWGAKEIAPCQYELIKNGDQTPSLKVDFSKLSSEYTAKRVPTATQLSSTYVITFQGRPEAVCSRGRPCWSRLSITADLESPIYRRVFRAMSYIQSHGCVAQMGLND